MPGQRDQAGFAEQPERDGQAGEGVRVREGLEAAGDPPVREADLGLGRNLEFRREGGQQSPPPFKKGESSSFAREVYLVGFI